jgi:hypothetical protein
MVHLGWRETTLSLTRIDGIISKITRGASYGEAFLDYGKFGVKVYYYSVNQQNTHHNKRSSNFPRDLTKCVMSSLNKLCQGWVKKFR